MLDNTECTRLVGVGVFSGSFPRFQLGGFAVPAPARVMQSVETVKKAGGNLGQGNRVISARGPDAKFGFPTISYEGQSKRGRPALAHSEKDINMTTYVLVHGGGHGDGAGNVPPPPFFYAMLVILSTHQRLPASANEVTWRHQKPTFRPISKISSIFERYQISFKFA